jgi:hypothetical protein
MKLTLDVEERLAIPTLLPKEGSLSDQLMGKSILDKSMISNEERKSLRFDGIYQGKVDPETNFLKAIDLSNEEFELLYSEMLQKDKDRKINQTNVSLAIKIREAKTERKK